MDVMISKVAKTIDLVLFFGKFQWMKINSSGDFNKNAAMAKLAICTTI